MSEVKKIATRDSYGAALIELGKEHDNLVVLDADLAAATKTGANTASTGGAPLAATGADSAAIVWLAAATLAAGIGLGVVSRRRA